MDHQGPDPGQAINEIKGFWEGRNVVVTGAYGFIGSHVTSALAMLKANVVGVDWAASASVAWGELGLKNTVLKFGLHGQSLVNTFPVLPDCIVFHLAGMVSVQQCEKEPMLAFRHNTEAVSNLLCMMRQRKDVAAMVLASSDRVYGGGVHDDTDEMRPSDIYGATKAAADVLCLQAVRKGMRVAMLRHVNAYAELDPHLDHLIPGTILSLVRGQAPIIRSDGSPTKAYLHVSDVVSAYLTVGQALYEGRVVGPVNCAPPWQHTVKEIVQEACDVAGYDGPVTVTKEDLSQQDYIEILLPINLKALGWTQRVWLRDGLRRLYDYYKAKETL